MESLIIVSSSTFFGLDCAKALMRFSSKETFFVNHVMVLGDRKPHVQISLPDNPMINPEIRIIFPPKINKFLLRPLKPIILAFTQLA